MTDYPWLEPAWQDFLQRLGQDRLAHGLLVSGQAGLGKHAMAHAMAARLLCLQPGEAACGTCRSCALLAGGAHPDRFELGLDEGKHQIRIGQVRKVIASLELTTTVSPCKVAVIAPAETMNRSAANALLKNLEEPPGASFIILVSTNPARLPVTVRSRCQVISVRLSDQQQAIDWLRARTGMDERECRHALEAAAGSPLNAARLQADGLVERFTQVREALEKMLGRPRAAAACAESWKDIDAHLLWNWLSLQTATALRGSLSPSERQWPRPDSPLDPGRLAALQQAADRNRALVATPVRGDLLLQEWLLEWAGQTLAKTG